VISRQVENDVLIFFARESRRVEEVAGKVDRFGHFKHVSVTMMMMTIKSEF
jgi:hypothetical protein